MLTFAIKKNLVNLPLDAGKSEILMGGSKCVLGSMWKLENCTLSCMWSISTYPIGGKKITMLKLMLGFISIIPNEITIGDIDVMVKYIVVYGKNYLAYCILINATTARMVSIGSQAAWDSTGTMPVGAALISLQWDEYWSSLWT